jgi:hypothetical protein
MPSNHKLQRIAAFDSIGFLIVLESFKSQFLPCNPEFVAHRFHISANRNCSQEVFSELLSFTFWKPLKDGILQSRQPFRKPQLYWVTGVVVLIQRAPHCATFSAFPSGALDKFLKPSMLLHAGYVFVLYGLVSMVCF